MIRTFEQQVTDYSDLLMPFVESIGFEADLLKLAVLRQCILTIEARAYTRKIELSPAELVADSIGK